MHIPWALHLITLIILICGSVFHSALDVTYTDYKNPFTDNGLFSTSNNKSSKAIRIRYPSFTTVYGITIYEKFLATALDNIIIVYDISSSVRIENVHRIQLLKSIRGELLEFKFIDHEMLLFCDALTCRLCMLISPEKPCVEYLLTLNGEKTEELLYATAVKDSSQNINIRIVNKHANHAAILRFPSYYTISKGNKLVSLQSAEDVRIIEEHSLATAFNRRGYTFFVGSARRPYEPYINAKIEELIVMSVRITRICDKDRTEKLESRMDMALICGNFSFRTNVVSLAAEYDRDSDELIVVFQTIEKNENVACKYNMDLECQKVQNLNELPPYCFIFSRFGDGHTMRTCSKFGGVSPLIFKTANYIKEPLHNCDLEFFPSFAYRYGWLEQFHAFAGQLIAVLPGSGKNILSIKRLHGDGALFTVHSDAILNRVSHQTHQMASSLLWSLQLQQSQLPEQSRTLQFRVAADLSRNRIYFVQDNDLSYIELSCSNFYDSCDSLEQSNWSDPLQCLWCAMNNGSGYAFSRSKGIDCPFYTVDSFCAPFIEHVNIPSSNSLNYTSFEVYGRKFDRLHDIIAKVCNQNCTISHFGSGKLSCTVNVPSDAMENCSFCLEGKLGSLGRFNITFELPKKRDSHITNIILASTHSHSKHSRAVATIFAVIILTFLIVLILCLLRQFHKHKRKRMKECGKSGSQISLDTSHAPFVNNNPFSGLKRKGDEIKTFNPYENLFLEIDPKLQISVNDLELGDEIGKGNFGVVYRAVYRSGDGQLIDVACKTIDSQSDGVITGISEFLQEGLIMANFDHPNVARLIGISLSINNYPVIVTDFMAQGDLRHYIINPENRLTFGNLLDFGIQISKGMTYLHDKQFIHRDLAARNCMLDAYLVVKIADFGLSRDVSRCGMYQAIHKDRGIPIRWMPIESLEEQQPKQSTIAGNKFYKVLFSKKDTKLLEEIGSSWKYLANFESAFNHISNLTPTDAASIYNDMTDNQDIPNVLRELAQYLEYTFKADVWAYGIVLWELATRGLIPYADLEFTDILRLLKSGHRLMKPKGCPDNLYYHVMRRCWMEDPNRRPTFFELTEMMEDVVRQLRRGVSSGAFLDSHYERVSARSFTTSLTNISN
uniref:Protein kinase domain-containing protein n=2 Tax=Onchocerca TaxID=6281 RepID=A0A8R1TU38_ONCVO